MEQLTLILDKIITLQKSLLHVSNRKMEALKENDIDEINRLLKEELSHIRAMESLNIRREELQQEISSTYQMPVTTFSELLGIESLPGKEELREKHAELTACTLRLKNQNELNQDLLNQSLQFVNLSLDLVMGQQETGNYSQDPENIQSIRTHTIFNSKA
ncbi:FlgN protein [Bacillus sp. 349Y]|nr:FlgN protein [Bacillus sp. 349Y]